jgi:farnesyl-diphosphate farnesyltransferase
MTRTKDTENFPVGSWLVAAHHRPIVFAYYNFARAADDISDDPNMESHEKVRQLDEMDAQLLGGPGDGPAATVRDVLAKTTVPLEHCRDLLVAFKRDSVKPRTKDWADLMDYCRYSASPVGRFLLDLHGESRDTWVPGDALCNALQVLNHLQDAQDDFVQLDRVYLPQDWLTEFGATAEDIRLSKATPAIRAIMDRMLDETEKLVKLAKTLPPMVKDGGLRRETAVIVAVAERLLDLLKRQDPLAGRVELSKAAYAAAALTGLGRSFFTGGK